MCDFQYDRVTSVVNNQPGGATPAEGANRAFLVTRLLKTPAFFGVLWPLVRLGIRRSIQLSYEGLLKAAFGHSKQSP